MIPTSAAQIATITRGRVMAGNGEAVAVSVDIDSRRVDAGTCFVAIVGPRDDGHRYLQQAIASGAAVLLIQNAGVIEHLVGLSRTGVVLVPDTTAALQRLAAHVRERVDPTVVAITGSVGKTTTKSLTYELIRHIRPTHAPPGTSITNGACRYPSWAWRSATNGWLPSWV